MRGNVHVRFGVGVGVQSPGLHHVKVEPRSNNAIRSGLSSFSAPEGKHHQKFDLERHPEKAKGNGGQMRAKDRPLVGDHVTDEAFAELLLAWFGQIARRCAEGLQPHTTHAQRHSRQLAHRDRRRRWRLHCSNRTGNRPRITFAFYRSTR